MLAHARHILWDVPDSHREYGCTPEGWFPSYREVSAAFHDME